METLNIPNILSHSECSKKDTRRINQRLRHAVNTAQPISIYVGTCPDYSNDGMKYTFKDIGNGVPLLTRKQLTQSEPLFETLACLWRAV